eukprot:2485277-Amphidinium_carterae.2
MRIYTRAASVAMGIWCVDEGNRLVDVLGLDIEDSSSSASSGLGNLLIAGRSPVQLRPSLVQHQVGLTGREC